MVDEALAIVMFHLLREFSGDLNIGIESFKTRCRHQGNKWSQNVLILDIGGETTDIALMSLILEELNPFNPEEDRGYGGRYYKLTPQLLGSSGHLQLGGELITLKIFLLLKAAIADCLLSAISEGIIDDNRLKNILSELNEDFIDGNGKFKSGTLLACVDKDNTESDASYKDALEDAEKVLSTRFEKHPERLQTFYTLWEYAEEAKIQLGKKPDPKQTTEPTFVLTGQKISEMLGLMGNELDKKPELQEKTEPNTVPTEGQTDEENNTSSLTKSFENLSVTLTRQQFERAVTPVIQQAIGIAKGLVKNRLQDDKEQVDDKEQIDNKEQKEQVDWLILSGKTCNLDSVEHELYMQFYHFEHFLWNKERIAFIPEYSKLATSIGACYAEKLQQRFDDSEIKNMLRQGSNQLHLEYYNLSYFLPSSFERQGIGNVVEIFKVGDKLFLLDPQDSVVKTRSQWLGMRISSFIYRKDFEGMLLQLWGSYNLIPLANRLNKNEDEFRGTIKVQFEVDQNLDFSLLLCRHGKPHYLISSNIPSIQIELVKKSGTSSVAPTEENEISSVIFNGTKLLCDIAVRTAESANVSHTDAYTVLFEAGKDHRKELKVFCYEDGTKQQGLISKLEQKQPAHSGKHTFYFHRSDSDIWEHIGELPQPEINTEYPYEYYVSLDESGVLRIHASEVPYLTSDKEEDLLKEGYVFCTPLELEASELEQKRDPFSGIH